MKVLSRKIQKLIEKEIKEHITNIKNSPGLILSSKLIISEYSQEQYKNYFPLILEEKNKIYYIYQFIYFINDTKRERKILITENENRNII